jgi:proliferating cell nuclear antigen
MSDNCILKIISIQTQVFKILIESLKDVLKDVNLVFTDNNISLVATNQINSLFIKLKIKTSSLEEYSCLIKNFRIGINIPSLYKLMKTANNDDSLMLFIEENDKTNLGINLENKNKNVVT